MDRFNFSKDIAESIKMDAPMQNGPLARWQRKASGTSSPLKNLNKTPGKGAATPGKSILKTPGGGGAGVDYISNATRQSKTPGKGGAKTPGKGGAKTPGKGGAKTPGKMQEDRFIPNRSTTDLEYGHYALMKQDNEDEEEEGNAENREYKDQLRDAMEAQGRKILNFRTKPPEPKKPDMNNLNVLYSGAKTTSQKAQTSRHIPREPERVLDAPDLLDDYYLNLLDWSKFNLFAVALGNAVFLWNAENGTITHLMDLATEGEYFTSLSWVEEGAVLAVGISTGVVQLWDTEEQKLMRSMSGHAARVGSLSWNQHLLSSGSRTGAIHQHDVRVANHQIATLEGHSLEVCGLKWSPDGRHLASGGNDNMLNVWSSRMMGSGSRSQAPLYNFTTHQAAVKALSWCPWQPHLLASGGGTADRHIRFWNVQNGVNVGNTDTGSQVCALLWSADHKELISGHGYSLNHLRIWKYPSMQRVVDLVGHTSRILCMAMSPDGTTVASAAADETIRLWKCFDIKKTAKVTKVKEDKTLNSGLQKMNLLR